MTGHAVLQRLKRKGTGSEHIALISRTLPRPVVGKAHADMIVVQPGEIFLIEQRAVRADAQEGAGLHVSETGGEFLHHVEIQKRLPAPEQDARRVHMAKMPVAVVAHASDEGVQTERRENFLFMSA